MHKHVYAFTYYLMNSIFPLFIKYFDNPLITFQNLNHNLQIFLFTVAFEKQLELYFFMWLKCTANNEYVCFICASLCNENSKLFRWNLLYPY